MRNLTRLIIIAAWVASFPAWVPAQTTPNSPLESFQTRFANPNDQRPDGIVDTRPKPTPTQAPPVATKTSTPPPADVAVSASIAPVQKNIVIENSQANQMTTTTGAGKGTGTGVTPDNRNISIAGSQVNQNNQAAPSANSTGKKIGGGNVGSTAECQQIKVELRRAEHHLAESQSNNNNAERRRARQRVNELRARLAQCRN